MEAGALTGHLVEGTGSVAGSSAASVQARLALLRRSALLSVSNGVSRYYRDQHGGDDEEADEADETRETEAGWEHGDLCRGAGQLPDLATDGLSGGAGGSGGGAAGHEPRFQVARSKRKLADFLAGEILERVRSSLSRAEYVQGSAMR